MAVPYKLNYFEIETGIDSTSTFIHTGDFTATKLKKYLGTSNDILLGDGTTASLSGKQNTITLTTTGSSGAATLIGATLNIPNYGGALSGYVPYTGATQALNLGTNNGILLTDTGTSSSIIVTSSSTGSGAIVVNKSVDGQGVTVNNAGIGSGFYANNSSTGNGITIGNASTGKGLVIDNAALAIGDPFVYTLGGAAFVKAKIDYLGNITGNSFVKTGGTSSQFLKADGSVDSTAYGTGSVTSVAALTLGTTGTDLSSTVANGNTTPVITLNVPTASATNRGALSSSDWTTFNSKQNTITLTTSGSSGASTFISNTLNVPNYTLSGLGGVPTSRTLTINGTTQDLSADRTFSVGTVTSVGLTMPAAFSVASSPINSSGTIAVTGAGLASQYIRGDGALGDFPNIGGGGSSVSYYLNGSVNQGTFVGNTYYEMNKTPVIGAGTDFTINADGYIAQFITDANDPAQLLIPGGNFNFEMYFSASSGGGSPSFYIEVYKYNGTAFTLLGSSSATPEGITNGTAIDIYYTSVAIPETVLTITDRLAIRVYVTHSGRTITLHTEDNHLCEVVTTFSNGITALNGLTKQVQFLAVGTTGTDFNISSSVDTHTFNLPDAGATARGVVTTGTQSFAGNKTFIGTPILGSTAGDLFWTSFSSSSTQRRGLLMSDGATINMQIYTGGNSTLGAFTEGIQTLVIGTGVAGGGGSGEKILFHSTGRGNMFAIDAANQVNTSYFSLNASAGLTGTTANFTGQLTLGSTITNGTYTYTLPSATGTIALVGGVGVGTVTSVAALTLGTSGTDLSSTVANGNTTPVITLNVPTASATNRGALSSGDWTTFNGKQDTITLTTTGTSGAATFIANTLNIPQYQSVLTNPVTGTGTTNELSYWTSSSSIGSLSTATYPSLTELSYVKGVTSAIQTQLNSKQATITLTTTGTSGAATFISNTLNIPQYQSVLTNPVTGTGTTNTLPKFTGASAIGDSAITDDGTTVTLVSRALSGTSASFSSSATATAFIPTSSSIPTNGMYLGAANTLNFATNSGSRMSIGTTGSVTMVSTLSLGNYLTITNANTFIYGGTTVGSIQYGNSTSSTHLKTYGATHATLANVIQLTNNSVVSLTLAATGAATFASTIAATSASFSATSQFLDNTGASTTTKFIRISNTSGDMAIGVEGSTPSQIASGSGGIAYSTVLKTVSTTALILGTNSIAALTINGSTQAATFSSTVSATQGLFSIANNAGVQVRSGNTSNYTYIGLGRNSEEATIGIPAAADQFMTGTAAGDITINNTSGKICLGTAAVTRLAITSGGDVGIGTTTTTRRLNVYETFGVRANRTGTEQEIGFIGPTGSGVNDGYFTLSENGVTKVLIGANNSRSGATYFNGGGNVLIGTTTDNGFGRVQVSGNISVAGGVRFSSSGADANRWSVYWNGGTGDLIVVNNISDIRAKKDFDYDIKGLETIKKLKPLKFTWKDGTSHSTSVSGKLRQYGFIAQETMEADDYLAWHNTSQDTWGIEQYESFTAVIVKAIQEQQEQIENLKLLIK